MSTDDPLDGFRVPRAPHELRERVLRAAAHGGPREDERLLDRLAGSKAWWLGWAAAMALLVLLQSGPPARAGDPSGVREWRERLRRVEAELGYDGVQVGDTRSGRGESV